MERFTGRHAVLAQGWADLHAVAVLVSVLLERVLMQILGGTFCFSFLRPLRTPKDFCRI